MTQSLRRIFVIGVGNAYRSDDAVGLLVAQRLRRESDHSVLVREESGEGTALIESWQGADAVMLIDTVYSGVEPGTLHRFDVQAQRIPARFFRYSTHAFSVAEAIELARALDQLPQRCIIYGIEGQHFAAGVGLSPAMEKAIEEVVKRVRQEITRWKSTTAE